MVFSLELRCFSLSMLEQTFDGVMSRASGLEDDKIYNFAGRTLVEGVFF